MGSFKKVIVFMLFSFNLIFAFSAQSKVVDRDDFSKIIDLNKNCFTEINEKIKNILDISTLKLSKTLFKDESHLFVTNQIEGYTYANKIFLLYLENETCKLSLVDSINRPLKSVELKECICQRDSKK